MLAIMSLHTKLPYRVVASSMASCGVCTARWQRGHTMGIGENLGVHEIERTGVARRSLHPVAI